MALEKNRGPKPRAGEKVVVVGAGRSGVAATRLALKKGARVRLLDNNPAALKPEVKTELENLGAEIRLGPHKNTDFADATFVVPSPGMPIDSVNRYLDGANPEVLSEMELAWRWLDNEPILAVTGTSGKTTTASLAAAMLKAQGYSVFLGGNIGTPLSEYLLADRKADALVLEISSFQLQGCSTFCPRVGILLNISPNHLDYHKDFQEYADAKFRLFRCQDEGDLVILGPEAEELARDYPIKGRKIILSEADRFPDSLLLGAHNKLNAEAAWQGAKFFGVSYENAAAAVAMFKPLPHRLEPVADIDGVLYINDSKATTIAALKVALEAISKPVRLLCGGKFKGGDPASLAPLIREKVVEIGLFGASREVFEAAWKDLAPINWSPTLAEAVKKIAAGAKPGDVVLLSPATASFDLYENYQRRGDDFRDIVANKK